MSPSSLICALMKEPVARNPERSHPAGGSRDSHRPDGMSAGARAYQPAPAPGHFPGQPARNACPETIYQAPYRPGEGMPRALTRKLRTGRPLRRRQRSPD
jgi:hypothetical protein